MILAGAVMGVGATAMMDIWSQLVSLIPGQGRVNWSPVGRWVWHLRNGRVVHDDIGASAPVAFENGLGWAFHYFVGILYGIAFAWLAGDAWLRSPAFLPAWAFGIATVAAGWFFLQPCLGLGWAANRLPNRWTVRALNIAGHTVFALGLYGTALLLR